MKFEPPIELAIGNGISLMIRSAKLDGEGRPIAEIEAWNGSLLHSDVLQISKAAARKRFVKALMGRAAYLTEEDIDSGLLFLGGNLAAQLTQQATDTGIQLNDPDPWDEEVEGDMLLEEVVTLCRRFVAASPSIFDAVALWCLYSYVYDAFEISPLLTLTSPEKHCGKTTLLMLVSTLVPRALAVSNITSSALFRAVEKYKPTLLIDEADSFMTDNEELRGILNSGHRKATAYVIRTVGDNYDPQLFTTWTPKVIALIGNPPDTIEDRSLVVKMQRKRSGEAVEELRIDRLNGIEALQRRAARWAADHFGELKKADPAVPDQITNARARDNWRPLLAIADAVGGDWPERARTVAKLLAGGNSDSESARILILQDLKAMFDEQGEQLTSDDIIKQLAEMESRPWGEWKNGKAITKVGLARLLKAFGVAPKHWRNGGATERGYQKEDFKEIFSRYLGIESAHSAQGLESTTYGEIKSAQDPPSVPTASDCNLLKTSRVPTVPSRNGEVGEKINEKPPQGVASVAFMVTREMRQALADLNYSRSDIDRMTPDEAHRIIGESKVKEADSCPREVIEI